ncbi:3-phosphoshikimate 1-carboxyvinyltransferase [Candidatus Paracaedibacter symbiosus]|uniref:3-phosphoshikimate 1-carboxyvinyltransferase n=1 Tax=Candidatus Paracaedibacter symbiosus TaxID=244582 RepID=UPI000509C00E|nr:3-phosphoshikimate 1-carboxyvinyltransferase [Candidatus Paracaedibacter symbiosus]
MKTPNTLTSFRQSHLNGVINAEIGLPGDKSVSHRALILGALAHGNTQITGLNTGEDVEYTELALKSLGVDIIQQSPTSRLIHGKSGWNFKQPINPLYLGNSGTTARLLCGLLASSPLNIQVYGDSSLSQRPMRRVMTPLTEFGCQFEATPENTLPLTIKGSSKLEPIDYVIPVASSQVKSAIILAAMNTKGISRIIEPIKTRDHTERMLQYLDYPIHFTLLESGHTQIDIEGKHVFNAKDISVPGDPSAAAYIAVAAMICPYSTVRIENLSWNPLRSRIFSILQEMGANIKIENIRNECFEPIADIEVSTSYNRPCIIKSEDVPALIDEYPILSIAAAFAEGTSVFHGLRELRYKESDRLNALYRNLNLCGIETHIQDESLIINGIGPKPIFGGKTINAGKDHRIAMAFYIMGLSARNPLIIQGTDCIQSSFPHFIKIFDELSYLRAVS